MENAFCIPNDLVYLHVLCVSSACNRPFFFLFLLRSDRHKEKHNGFIVIRILVLFCVTVMVMVVVRFSFSRKENSVAVMAPVHCVHHLIFNRYGKILFVNGEPSSLRAY